MIPVGAVRMYELLDVESMKYRKVRVVDSVTRCVRVRLRIGETVGVWIHDDSTLVSAPPSDARATSNQPLEWWADADTSARIREAITEKRAGRRPRRGNLCEGCGRSEFWSSEWANEICRTCHPPAVPELEVIQGRLPVRARDTRLEEVRAGHARGWTYTPLRGKAPYLRNWQSRPAESLATSLIWARQGNIGLRTGRTSGLVAIDVDLAKGAVVPADVEASPTWTVLTGGGGIHAYYALPEGVEVGCPTTLFGNGAHIEVKGNGGQVVAVGSVHPVTNRVYSWQPGRSPLDLLLAMLPASVLERLARHAVRSTPGRPHSAAIPQGTFTTYGRAALRRAAREIAETAPGSRNVALNATAYSLARLAEAGHLAREDVEASLIEASTSNGYHDEVGDHAVREVIASGFDAGRAAGPRGPTLPWATSRTKP